MTTMPDTPTPEALAAAHEAMAQIALRDLTCSVPFPEADRIVAEIIDRHFAAARREAAAKGVEYVAQNLHLWFDDGIVSPKEMRDSAARIRAGQVDLA